MNPLETDKSHSPESASHSPSVAAIGHTTTASSVRLSRIATIVGVLIVLGFLAGFIPRWHQRNLLRAETVDLATPSVAVVSAKPSHTAAGLVLPAEVRPWLEAPIYSRGNGYLKRWLVDIGAHVEAGQLLAEVDTPELDQQLEQARAQLAESEAALALAKTTAERWADLLKTASVSEQEDAEKQADYKLKSATVEAGRANVHRLEQLQSFERIMAPFAGTITARNTDVGDLITAGSGKELFHLAQTGTLRVYVRVPQSAARGIVTGQSAELLVPEIPGQKFPATVTSTSEAMSTDSRTLLTELQVDNSKGEVLPGSYGQVRFLDSIASTVLTLPSNTLLFRAEGLQVGVVGADSKVDLRSVSIGRDFGETVEVLAGVNSSDRVVINPADSLVSGTTVHIADAAPAKNTP
jgi:RND family efflux transporter MFP subunit